MTNTALPLEERADDLCAKEPIQRPGSVQPHGVLLAVDPRSFRVVVASVNASALLGWEEPIGLALSDVLPDAFAQDLAARYAQEDLPADSPWETTFVATGGRRLDVASHLHDGVILVEIEPPDEREGEEALVAARALQRAVSRLRGSGEDVETLAQVAVTGIRAISGYERVLVYRFDERWDGEAIAEDKVDDWEQSFLGLHFPASDIPRQARDLYARSPLRWVPRRDYEPVPLLSDPAWRPGVPLDLSFARLRSLSPVHLQYHRNMGVDGTMSLSILRDGRLWGLVVCHHREPHKPSAGQRSAVAALTDAFALRLAPAERAGMEALRRADVQRIGQVLAHLADSDDVVAAAATGSVRLDDLFRATGAVAISGDKVGTLGRCPVGADLATLVAWLRERTEGELFGTQNLAGEYPPASAYPDVASGLLAIFLTPDKADMFLWFRPEQARLVSWGGDPRKDASTTAPAPRLSFERWVETRHGESRAWELWELETALDLRQSIIEVIVRNLRRVADLNERLRQSQKMEAVGQLTGGLAHDFNNLLTGITGSLDLLQARIAQGRISDVGKYVAAAQGAAKRAAALTHRLLAFSRRQTLDPKPVDVNKLVAGMEEMVRRTVGPAIAVEVVGKAGLWLALVDENQLENALLNLCINARDAMPDGGRITIETANKWLDVRASKQRDLPEGQYLTLCVTDTGTGMTPEVIERAFDPFFTTKPLGEGTGLGLSMIYGFARQSNGQVRIYSELGQGTTMCIYLPRHVGRAVAAEPEQAAEVARAGHGETVLVVDDEPTIRMLVNDVLADFGYGAIEAVDGASALKVLQSSARVDLLVTDVGLPGGLNGRQVADAGRSLRPGLKVLFITGYAENAAVGNGHLDHGMRVLTKPFAMDALASRIRDMIEER